MAKSSEIDQKPRSSGASIRRNIFEQGLSEPDPEDKKKRSRALKLFQTLYFDAVYQGDKDARKLLLQYGVPLPAQQVSLDANVTSDSQEDVAAIWNILSGLKKEKNIGADDGTDEGRVN